MICNLVLMIYLRASLPIVISHCAVYVQLEEICIASSLMFVCFHALHTIVWGHIVLLVCLSVPLYLFDI
jgi:hypothetical protein